MKNFILVFLMIFPIAGFSEVLGDLPAFNKEINSFFELAKNNEYQKAIEVIIKISDWDEKANTNMREWAFKMEARLDAMGKLHSYERILSSSLSERYEVVQYLAYYESTPLLMEFVFYKPNKKWKIYIFRVDENIDELVENEMAYQAKKTIQHKIGM